MSKENLTWEERGSGCAHRGWKVSAQRKSTTDWRVRGLTWGWGGREASLLRPQEKVGWITQSLEQHVEEFEPYSVGQLGAKEGCFIQINPS